jgi:hypothetical protein
MGIRYRTGFLIFLFWIIDKIKIINKLIYSRLEKKEYLCYNYYK